jgi:hypothetical protein
MKCDVCQTNDCLIREALDMISPQAPHCNLLLLVQLYEGLDEDDVCCKPR